MAVLSSETIQAACAALDGRAVLIESRNPELRSDLLIQLLDRGAGLVANGRTICLRESGKLLASPLAGEGGHIEVRGVGIIARDAQERVPVSLVVVLLDSPPRNPNERRTRTIAGVELPVLALAAGDPAAAIKVGLALETVTR